MSLRDHGEIDNDTPVLVHCISKYEFQCTEENRCLYCNSYQEILTEMKKTLSDSLNVPLSLMELIHNHDRFFIDRDMYEKYSTVATPRQLCALNQTAQYGPCINPLQDTLTLIFTGSCDQTYFEAAEFRKREFIEWIQTRDTLRKTTTPATYLAQIEAAFPLAKETLGDSIWDSIFPVYRCKDGGPTPVYKDIDSFWSDLGTDKRIRRFLSQEEIQWLDEIRASESSQNVEVLAKAESDTGSAAMDDL